jgi:hypothetical protein
MGGVWIEGLFARLMYLSLYKMHEIALHGVPTVLLDTLARRITRRTRETALSRLSTSLPRIAPIGPPPGGWGINRHGCRLTTSLVKAPVMQPEWAEKMVTEQNIPQPAAATGRSRDLLSKLYREIGISAVVAALEATARKPQKSVHNRKDLPAVLRGDEAA